MSRPTGVAYVLTEDWKKAVIAAMREKNWNKAELARRLGCSRTAVTDMLSDGQTSTLVPDVEKLLDLPISLINFGADDGKYQFIGPTGEIIDRPLGSETPAPLAETYEKPVLVPTRFRSTATKGQRPDDEYVQSSDASFRVMEIFADLNTRNRVKAVKWLSDLLEEQNQIEHEIAARVHAEQERDRVRRLDERIASYLPTETHRIEGNFLGWARRLVAAKTVRELSDRSAHPQGLPAKGTKEREIALELLARHRQALDSAENKLVVDFLKELGETKIDDLKPGTMNFLRLVVTARSIEELNHVEDRHPFKSRDQWPKLAEAAVRKKRELLFQQMDPAMRSEYERH